MSGRKLDNSIYLDDDWQDEIESKNLLKKGFFNIVLTNFTNKLVPAIAAGSSVDIDGVLYKFDTEEAITGSPGDGVVYIVITGIGSNATALFTNTAPNPYDHDKKGIYFTNTERFVAQLVKSGSDYTSKILYGSYVDDLLVKNLEVTEMVKSDLNIEESITLGGTTYNAGVTERQEVEKSPCYILANTTNDDAYKTFMWAYRKSESSGAITGDIGATGQRVYNSGTLCEVVAMVSFNASGCTIKNINGGTIQTFTKGSGTSIGDNYYKFFIARE
jgi:hypothetical protein